MKLSVLLASCLPLLSVAADLPSLPANIEVDLIFPRNDTYAPAEHFPLILAVQNAALAWDFGFYITWDVKNLSSHTGSSFVDSDTWLVSNTPEKPAPSDPFFMVNSTAELETYRSNGVGTYQFSWFFTLSENCTDDGDFVNHTIGATLGSGSVVFSIANGAKTVNLAEGGPCPASGFVVGIQSNITGCPHIDNSGISSNPCNIVVDDALASSLSAKLPVNTGTTSSATSTTAGGSLTTTAATSTGTTAAGASTGTTTAGGSTGATTAATSRASSATSTTATANNAAHAPLQTAAAVLAGAVGLCAMLV